MSLIFQNILVGLDLDHAGFDKTLAMATDMAKCSGSKLTAVYACPDYTAIPMVGDLVGDSVIEQAYASYRARLDEVCQNAIDDDIEWQTKVGICKGHNAYQCITEMAKEIKADLIVIGEHDRHGLDHILLGSNAEKTVRYAPCTVLVVKHSGE